MKAFLLAVLSILLAPQTVKLDSDATLRPYEGLGVLVSYGKLLKDYPEPQRSEILDYLFLPGYGASLQILKVEMGYDGNNTAISWPSHQRTLDEKPDFTRGTGWWYMEEAKKRNPDIILSALNWGWPAWTRTDEQKACFIADYVEGAWKQHGLHIDYIGGNQNESELNTSVTRLLRKELDERGFSDVRIICADEGARKPRYEIIDTLASNKPYADVVDVIGVHFKGRPGNFMPESTYTLGKRLWSTEDGGGSYTSASQGAGWVSQLMKLFLDVRMTAAIRWLSTASVYDNMPWPNNGIMRTKEPWCGHYQIGPNLWAFAHFTQFIKPGWQLLDTRTSWLDPAAEQGRLAAWCDPSGRDWAAVVDASKISGKRVLSLRPSGSLNGAKACVWRSRFKEGGELFEQVESLLPDAEGLLTLEIEPGCVYTVTSIEGQRREPVPSPIPERLEFPLPYSEDFDTCPEGTQPRYFVDCNSVFEVAKASGRRGKVLRQVIREAPQMWHPTSGHPFQPVTEVGGMGWTDYCVSVDAYLENRGKAVLGGRIDALAESSGDHGLEGYWLTLGSDGAWTLRKKLKDSEQILAEGTLDRTDGPDEPFLKKWLRLSLEFRGQEITASIGEKVVAAVKDTTYSAGNTILGTLPPTTDRLHKYTEKYCTAQFDDFCVEPR